MKHANPFLEGKQQLDKSASIIVFFLVKKVGVGNPLVYNTSQLNNRLGITTAGDGVELLEEIGMVSVKDNTITLLVDVPYPSFMMNDDILKLDKQKLSVLALNCRAIEDLNDNSDIEYGTRKVLKGDRIRELRKALNSLGLNLDSSLFEPVDIECENLTTIVEAREVRPKTTTDRDARLDRIEANQLLILEQLKKLFEIKDLNKKLV